VQYGRPCQYYRRAHHPLSKKEGEEERKKEGKKERKKERERVTKSGKDADPCMELAIGKACWSSDSSRPPSGRLPPISGVDYKDTCRPCWTFAEALHGSPTSRQKPSDDKI